MPDRFAEVNQPHLTAAGHRLGAVGLVGQCGRFAGSLGLDLNPLLGILSETLIAGVERLPERAGLVGGHCVLDDGMDASASRVGERDEALVRFVADTYRRALPVVYTKVDTTVYVLTWCALRINSVPATLSSEPPAL